MESKNKVSIMMPVFNGMPLIQASVESVMRQTYENWECIIVDDGSTDGTSEYLDSLKDPRFIVHHFEKNKGRPAARQKALELTTGVYIAMLDAEDLISPDRLAVQAGYLDKNPNVALVSSRMCSFGTNTEIVKVRGASTLTTIKFDGKRCPIHAASMMRGEKAKKIKYNPSLKYGQDVDFLERYLEEEYFTELPCIHYYYSEFDSVTKRKIRRTYKLVAQKYLHAGKYSMSFKNLIKYLYSVIVFPFVSIDSILAKRGIKLSADEYNIYQDECLRIVSKIMKKKICFVVAVPITALAFLKDHIKLLSVQYNIYLVGNINTEDDVKGLKIAGWKKIDIERGISITKDLRSVWQARCYFKQMKFDAVHSVTPKAGLVTALASKLANIKHRTHIFTGQVWATRTGLMRQFLKSIDKIIAKCDNHIMVDGKSQRTFLEKEGVLKPGKALVFCEGSIAGVNSERFVPDVNARKEEREKIGIKEDILTYIFLGRLNHDKGIGDLYEAFNRLAAEEKDVFLLLVGFDEEGYLQKLSEYKKIQEGKNFHFYGPTSQPERVLNAGDVFVLPTYREGFGSSVLEAACIGLPSICTDAYGVLDAYIDGETGLQCKVGDAETLYQCMKKMHDNPEMRIKMGKRSRERALQDFNVKPISEAWVEFYRGILKP